MGQSRLKEQFDNIQRTKVQRMLEEPQGRFFFPFLFFSRLHDRESRKVSWSSL